MSKVVKIISFRETALFRRGLYLSAAALAACVAAPALLALTRTSFWSSLTAAGAMLAAAAIVLVRSRAYRLADEVMDCGDYLKVRRGSREFSTPIADIARVEVAGAGGIHRITVHMRRGAHAAAIDFLPQASLWSNRAALNALARDLNSRARLSSPRERDD